VREWLDAEPAAGITRAEIKIARGVSRLFDRIADLEQRLAGATAGWDMALAALADARKQIEELGVAVRRTALDAEVCVHECECGRTEPIRDWDIGVSAREAAALLSPATDKGA